MGEDHGNHSAGPYQQHFTPRLQSTPMTSGNPLLQSVCADATRVLPSTPTEFFSPPPSGYQSAVSTPQPIYEGEQSMFFSDVPSTESQTSAGSLATFSNEHPTSRRRCSLAICTTCLTASSRQQCCHWTAHPCTVPDFPFRNRPACGPVAGSGLRRVSLDCTRQQHVHLRWRL